MPYYIPTISFGPIVYKEPSSVLQSRISHSMNFVNEIGPLEFTEFSPEPNNTSLDVEDSILNTFRVYHMDG